MAPSAESVLFGHAVQFVAFSWAEYVFRGHTEHVVVELNWYIPGWHVGSVHGKHSGEPCSTVYVPGGHVAHPS